MTGRATLTRTVGIDAPVDKVFALALDIGKFWKWTDFALTGIDLKPDGVGSSAVLYGHVMAIHVEGLITYTEVVPNERIVAQVGFGPEHPTWTFTFEPVVDSTELTAQGEWHVNVPGIGKRMEGMLVKEHEEGLENMLRAFKTEVEGTG